MQVEDDIEHVDVLVVGAGLSGVGAAAYLRQKRPRDTVAVLEARSDLGGTWDLFRYPGIRSDSDMFTLGYAFEPWTEAEAIADGPAILDYIRRTARKYGVDQVIRYRHRVVAASWSSSTDRWTVEVEQVDDEWTVSATTKITCRWLHLCTGYYRYDEGYTPPIPGLESFAGRVVHAQHWPDDVDVGAASVVVVGSGATAVTVIPSLASTAGHVTMLQRSPTYVVPMPSRDRVADAIRHVLPPRQAHGVVRWKNAVSGLAVYQLSRRRPLTMRRFFRRKQAGYLTDEQIDEHFVPSYPPWDQRVCLAPDGDLFRCIQDGRVDVVTDTIDHIAPSGIQLASGRHLPADMIVLATGLQLLAFGGMRLAVDGVVHHPRDAVVYKGMALADVPNLTFVVGYTNAAWTLKADLVNAYLVRLLNHCDANGLGAVVPVPPPDGGRVPLIDLKAGYVRRSVADLPTQGTRTPWRLHQNYPLDVLMLRWGKVNDRGVRFIPPGAPVSRPS